MREDLSSLCAYMQSGKKLHLTDPLMIGLDIWLYLIMYGKDSELLNSCSYSELQEANERLGLGRDLLPLSPLSIEPVFFS